MGLFYILKSSP